MRVKLIRIQPCDIARIPVEILQAILSHLPLFARDEPEDYTMPWSAPGVAIYHVFQLWRDVVRDMGDLWMNASSSSASSSPPLCTRLFSSRYSPSHPPPLIPLGVSSSNSPPLSFHRIFCWSLVQMRVHNVGLPLKVSLFTPIVSFSKQLLI